MVKSCPARSEQTLSLPNNPLGALKSWSIIFTQNYPFPEVQSELPWFQIVPTDPCPVAGHHWKDPGSVLYASFPWIFVQIDASLPEPCFLWPEKSQLSQPLSLLPLNHFHVPLQDSLQSVHLYWGIQNWTQNSKCGLARAK